MLRKCIAMDLGTANTLVYVQSQGIVLNEPSVVAIERGTGRVLAVGLEAKSCIGRTPQHIQAIRPLKDGVIADFDTARALIAHFLRQVIGGRSLIRPDVVICVPLNTTDVERRAVVEAGLQAGAREVRLIEEPMAGAIGAGLPINEPVGNMIVDIGGGTTDVAVITLGGMASSRSLRVAGDELNLAVQRHVQEAFQLLVGENMAEKIKMTIGTVTRTENPQSMVVSGKDTVSGTPRSLVLTGNDICEAMASTVAQILSVIRSVFETTPPELGGDIVRSGILLTGGGSLLHGLPEYISQAMGLEVRLDQDPLTTVLRGAGKTLDAPAEYRDCLLSI